MGNPVVHFEIGCRDSEKAKAFYSSVFGWNIQPMGPAMMIDTGSDQGIAGHIVSLGHEPHNFTNIYVEVDDLQAAIDKAVAEGGRLVVPPMPIPTGEFAWIADPEGLILGLFKTAG